MRIGRVGGRLARGAVWAVMLAPLVALIPVALLDRGPHGRVRATVFPLVLTAFDPLVRHSIEHSLVVAALTAFGSLVLGVGLAHGLTRWRFWGRKLLVALAWGTLAVPPLFLALGIRELAGHGSALGWSIEVWPRWGAWLAWIWIGLVSGVPIVGLASTRALERIDPAWEDAGRSSGAGRLRLWWDLVWMLTRKNALGAAGLVFAWTLLEPGAPLVLGLRRTLAFQLVEAATSSGPGWSSRLASLGLVGLMLAGLARVGVHFWAGGTGDTLEVPTRLTRRRARWDRASSLVTASLIWSVFAWTPCIGLLLSARDAWSAGPSDSGSLMPVLGHGSEVWRTVRDSVLLGLAAGTSCLILSGFLAGSISRKSDLRPRLGWLVGSTPPLVLAAGLLCLPRAILDLADGLGVGAGGWAEALSSWIDAYATPGAALVWTLALVQLPFLVEAVGLARSRFRAVRMDAALTLGVGRSRAWRALVVPMLVSSLFGPWLLAACLSANDATAALVLSPTSAFHPVGPAVLDMSGTLAESGRASALALVASVLNLLAMGLAFRRKIGVWG